MSAGHTVLPFANLAWPRFEAFIFEVLSSGLRIELPARRGAGRAPTIRRVVRVVAYGGPGDAQRGIDFFATMDDGSMWVFQAKLTPKFGADKAKAAVTKARREFSKAQRYFLMVSGTPTTRAADHVRRRHDWEMWDGVGLTAHFLRGIPIQRQIEIVGRIWPEDAARLVSQFYPLRDALLVTPDEFFATWLNTDRLFHHRSALVGQTEVLDSLSTFLRDPIQRAFILVAPGGRGKSRLLRAFADLVARNHPDFEIRFVDPLAPPSARPESLRASGEIHFVIVQDDAHRTETIRPELLGLLAQTRGKIVFATRPQAVAALEQHLVRTGFSAHTIFPPVQLPKLKLPEYEQLALSELYPEHRHHARFLARMGRDCPLVITVGAALVNKGLIPPDKFEAKLFQNEVFARFEGEELDRLAAEYPRGLVRRVIQTIAVLAPWAERETDVSCVAEFAGCTELELRGVLAQLEAGQLVLATGRGRRVVPDLFADHLVYTACYESNGTLSDFARQLAEVFATEASQTMLRNLAEADWQAARYHKKPASLIDPFWASLWKLFNRSDFFSRGLIIERWSAHSVYQPQRSLELAQLAMHLKRAPAPADPSWFRGKTGDRLNSHQQVLRYVPGLLEPIAIYHEEHREQCLHILFQLVTIWPPDAGLEDQNHPWTVVARIAEFKLDHPITAPGDVLSWLEKHIGDAAFKSMLERPSKVLAKVLNPIFARHLNASYSEGNTFHICHPPICIAQTRHLRDRALHIIEHKIIPRGEIAVLNSLPLLNEATDGVRSQIGSKLTSHIKRLWLPERRKALAVIERLIATNPSKRVRWKVRTHLRDVIHTEPSGSAIRKRCATLLTQLPLEGEIAEVAAMCSYGWQEFEEIFFKKGRPTTVLREDLEKRWVVVLNSVACDFIARAGEASQLFRIIERELDVCGTAAFTPNIKPLLSAIGAQNASLSKAVVEFLLRRTRSSLAWNWCSFLAGNIRFPDEWLEGMSLRALGTNSVRVITSLLDFLYSAVSGPTPANVLAAVGRWATHAVDKRADLAITALGWARSADDPVWHTIASNLDIKRLSGEQLATLVDTIGHAMRYQEVVLPSKIQRTLLREMVRIPELKSERSAQFRQIMADKDPSAVFNLYLARVKVGRSRNKPSDYQPLPLNIPALCRLPDTPEYATIARKLLREIRTRSGRHQYEAKRLFQSAVLQASSLGAELLLDWATSARSFEELERIASLAHFDGSILFLRQPALALTLLRRGREFRPAGFPQWEARLAAKMGPIVHAFTNGIRDKEQNYVADEANKLLANGGAEPELESFYRAVLKHELEMATSWHRGGLSIPDDEEDEN